MFLLEETFLIGRNGDETFTAVVCDEGIGARSEVAGS